MTIPDFDLYLFDIDGTLVDSAADICGAVRETLEAAGAMGLSEAYLQSYIGYHLNALFADVFPGITDARQAELLADYRRLYPAREHRSTRMYPGVVEMLTSLRGFKSTATTKNSTTANSVLSKFDLVRYFDHVQGTDGFPSKPAPDVILKSLERFHIAPERCLMIGDAPPDLIAGRAAGVKTCAVSWGYGDKDKMRAAQPDYWIESIEQLYTPR